MRFLGAVRGTVRFASEDIVYRDVLFPQGTIVSTSLAGANRDPEVWHDPNDFDITVERGTAQMTFGAGIHFCMGAALARAELQEALPLLARRMPGLGPQRRRSSGSRATFGIWGPAHLPIRFDTVLTGPRDCTPAFVTARRVRATDVTPPPPSGRLRAHPADRRAQRGRS